ncbi:NAD(P)/FAD-dependent oxidoreductase [Nocardia cerradoensis]|uniref:Rhodocoxin reductase n=1 Tax=Nocardia cerradoensis TaxID=85688 RepID=A0A231H068_9NOCA|nr:FAD-dependent oxidoreductase [Nocardia cerradoensis]NKY42053.1 FAD-dependent oxidoreductase [Nocardia cerradoensis]OXR42250.1 Rhodocoxin reductase [Nocardia cerradoensis]
MTGKPVDGQHVDILLVGGGVAAANAAEELRRNGFDGTIAVATRESDPPYYRFYLTKEYLRGKVSREDLFVHSPEWWQDNDIALWLRAPVANPDLDAHTVRVGRRTVSWGRMLLATGSTVRPLICEGAGLRGVHYLRTTWNAADLRDEARSAARAVVVGGSFIAAETAASLAALGLDVAMVFPEDLPFVRALGAPIGALVADELARLGVRMVPHTTAAAFQGTERVDAVTLSTGVHLPADLVVVGTGSRRETTLATAAGLPLGPAGGILCDSTLRAHDAVWAAGDVCEFHSVRLGRATNIEHDRVAAAQGRHAARSMLGAKEPFDALPYFWTSVGAELRIDVLGFHGPGRQPQPLNLAHHPDLAARFTPTRGLVGTPQAFRYSVEGSTVGYASVNGALHLRVAGRHLAQTSAPQPRRAHGGIAETGAGMR